MRPLPLHRQFEDVLIDISQWRNRVMRDGRITEAEAMEALPILDTLTGKVGTELVMTLDHVSTCIQGQSGMFSKKAVEGWKSKHSRRTGSNIVQLFPETGDAA